MSVHALRRYSGVDTSVGLLTREGMFFADPIVFDATGSRVDRQSWTSLAEHLHQWGERPSNFGSSGQWLAQQIEQVQLTGRGGAHVPSILKWRAAVAAGPGGTVVVNGAEGEPASGKDAALLHLRPHLVLDGAVAMAEGIGAREIVVWLHESAETSRLRLAHAVLERREWGLNDPTIRLMLAPDGYVSGESSAIIRAVRGGPALPQHAKDRARPWGDGPAIVVHNAETCARIGVLAHVGAEGYDPTSLVTVAQMATPTRMRTRTVLEASAADTLSDLVSRAGVEEPSAILLGGYGGSWIAWEEARDLPADPEVLRERGLSLGAGVILVLPRGADGLAVTASLLGYLADQSARQCGPCTFGLPSMAEAMQGVVRGRKPDKLRALAQTVSGRGACRHPDGAIRMALSAVEVFA